LRLASVRSFGRDSGKVAKSEPIYELKMAFSLHAYYCSEHVGEFASRVREMRQPPYGLEVSPHAALDLLFDEIMAAPNTPALLVGLYEYAVPELIRALENLIADTNKLFDHPTYRICRLTLVEMQDLRQYGTNAVRCLVSQDAHLELRDWGTTLERMLAAAGGLDGKQDPTELFPANSPRSHINTILCQNAMIGSRILTTWVGMPKHSFSMTAFPLSRRPSCCTSSACVKSTCPR
jgi:hypothetical protein